MVTWETYINGNTGNDKWNVKIDTRNEREESTDKYTTIILNATETIISGTLTIITLATMTPKTSTIAAEVYTKKSHESSITIPPSASPTTPETTSQ